MRKQKVETRLDLKFTYKKGLKDGIPIALGYFAVSFAFGVSVVSKGMPLFIALFMSMTNLTSAGQVAGATVVIALGTFIEIILTQLIINARYFLMGITLSQRLDSKFTLLDRFLCSFGITDEIFGVAVSYKKPISKQYLYGLILLPFLGWRSKNSSVNAKYAFAPEHLVSCSMIGTPWLGASARRMFLGITVSNTRFPKNFLISFEICLEMIARLSLIVRTTPSILRLSLRCFTTSLMVFISWLKPSIA